MTEVENIVKFLLEADEDDGTTKDILGPEYYDQWVSGDQAILDGFGDDRDGLRVTVLDVHGHTAIVNAQGYRANISLDRLQRLPVQQEAEDDDETIKDILGVDYLEPPPPESALRGEVDRFDRWADITIGNNSFCISYLTPVAARLTGQGLVITDKDWSNTTTRHIKKWLEYTGNVPDATERKWAELKRQLTRVPQQDLIDMFKRESVKVMWTKQQANKATTFRPPKFGLKGGTEDRVSVEPYHQPK